MPQIADTGAVRITAYSCCIVIVLGARSSTSHHETITVRVFEGGYASPLDVRH